MPLPAPAISVVLPVYNGGPTLQAAYQSVIEQQGTDFELIVIDDGSTDDSWNIISSWDDQRLRRYRQKNSGLPATLNRGIALAEGRYIARQDQDDLLLQGRLTKQAEFLDAKPEVGLVGTWAKIYEGQTPTQRLHKHPSGDAALRLRLLFDNPIVHSSVMLRTSVLRQVEGYCTDPALQPPEDYDLWSRMAHVCQIANIPEVLTIYREIPNSMSRDGAAPFQHNGIRISTQNMQCVIGDVYDIEKYRAVAKLYAGLHSDASVSLIVAKRIVKAAATQIGGQKAGWSQEYAATVSALNGLIFRRWFKSGLAKFAATTGFSG